VGYNGRECDDLLTAKNATKYGTYPETKVKDACPCSCATGNKKQEFKQQISLKQIWDKYEITVIPPLPKTRFLGGGMTFVDKIINFWF
jgi:hypothetical protein